MTKGGTLLAAMLTLPLWLAALLAFQTGAAASWGAAALGWAAILAAWRGMCLARADGLRRWLAALAGLLGAGALFLPLSAGLLMVLSALLAISWLTLEARAHGICGDEPALFTAAAAPLFALALSGLA